MAQMTIRRLEDGGAEALAYALPQPATDSADLIRGERDRRSGLID
jgi:hypothetical protein